MASSVLLAPVCTTFAAFLVLLCPVIAYMPRRLSVPRSLLSFAHVQARRAQKERPREQEVARSAPPDDRESSTSRFDFTSAHAPTLSTSILQHQLD